MKQLLIHEIYQKEPIDQEICVKGWIKTRRDSKGGFSFLEINDGSSLKNLQIIADNSLKNYQQDILKLFPGASVKVEGILVSSPGGNQKMELKAESVRIYGFSDVTTYPLQKQRISFEKLREIAHLRGRTNTFGAVTRVRNALSFATHCFFQERNFYYLNTPIITTSDCEGAGQLFRVTTLDFNNLPKNKQGNINCESDFFSQEASLTVSGQLEAETYACGLGRVYTFGPTFRAENSNTSRHLAEFWMVEPEMAFTNLTQDIALAEDYLKYLINYILNHCKDDLEFFNLRIENSLLEQLNKIVSSKFITLTYTDAVKILSRNRNFSFPVEWGIDLQSEHEQYLTEVEFKKPVVLTDYPKSIKPFYMRMNDDNKTVAAMDVLLPKIGEIIGGSQREERLDCLQNRLKELDLHENDYWWYLDLRRYGTVPHSGFGLGFERLVKLCTGMGNIRDTIPFPRVPGNAKF